MLLAPTNAGKPIAIISTDNRAFQGRPSFMMKKLVRSLGLAVAVILFAILFTATATKQSASASTATQTGVNAAKLAVGGNRSTADVLLPLVEHSSESTLLLFSGFSFVLLASFLRLFPMRRPTSEKSGS
jgi:hypothetical protein